MGKIAKIGEDASTKLFRKILLASSAMPIVFPPVFFEVEADGKKYNEMHVDGGTVTQVFSLYGILQGTHTDRKEEVYLIWNGFVSPKQASVKDSLSEIANRSLFTMVNYQGLGDIFRLYILSKERKNDFHLAYIPSDFDSDTKQMFDPVEMTKLFDLGYKKAVEGTSWQNAPTMFEIFKDNKAEMVK